MNMLILFGGMIVLIMIGFPVGYAIGLATIGAIYFCTDLPLTLVAQNCFTGLDSFVILAIPFFILAGVIMGEGGIARRLVNLADAIVGFITGGLGLVAILTSTFFGAITGSGNATTSAVGSILIPSMTEKGYEKHFSGALIAAGGAIGVIIPPSVPFVIYGVATGTSISDMFMAGIIPGLIMCVCLMVACYMVAKKKGYGNSGTKPTLKNIWIAFKDGIWALLAPIIILGGIYSGAFTPTESAVVAVVYSIIAGCFIYRELSFKKLIKCFYLAAVINGITTFLIGFSASMAKYVTIERIPQMLCDAILGFTSNKILVLLLINLMLLLIGMLIDMIPAVIILSPILLPVVTQIGVDPIQFGVILVMNLAIGFITPPYGSTLFVSAAITDIPVERMFKYAFIFMCSLLVALMLVSYVPWLTLALIQ